MIAPQAAAPSALPDPEVVPSMDEHPPEIPPNLAGNQTLCANVTKFLVHRYWYAYEQQQMRLWPIWRRIDDAWRARTQTQDLVEGPSLTEKMISELTPQDKDGMTAKAQNAALHKQIDALTKIGLQIAWDEGKPVRFTKPKTVYEHPIYNPEQQAVDVANELLDQTANDIDLRVEYRKNWGCFCKYGHAWAWTDFRISREIVTDKYRVGPDPVAVQAQLATLMQRYQGQQPQVIPAVDGSYEVSFQRKMIKEMTTGFRHLNVQDVFVDQLIACHDMERQPCPFIREHCTELDLWGNDYNPEDNPFGWLNTELALANNGAGHYALSQSDEGHLRDQLAQRYGMSDVYAQSTRATIRQRWTVYPLLGLDETTGEVDYGEGVTCTACVGGYVDDPLTGSKTACSECKGTGNKRIKPERYVVQIFGGLHMANVCLRIQKLPPKFTVPILFAADVIEDTAAAIPMSKAEVALVDNDQLLRAENQFLESKDLTIYRGWKVKNDSPASLIQNFNVKNKRIEFEVDPAEATRVESNAYDETATILPYLQRKEDSISRIMGATEQLLGMLASGRRSALEIGNAIDAGKNPIIVMNDGYNRQMCGRWATLVIKNIEMWGDRDWIRKKTGKGFFGVMRTFTAVGEEFVKKLTLTQNLRYLAEASTNSPALQPVAVQLWNKVFKVLGVDDIEIPDGGMRKAQQDAMKIVAKIMGNGQLLPPTPDDPHEIYVQIFTEALRSAMTDEDDYWATHAPQNIPLLMQRLEMQRQLLMQQQMAMMMQQMQQAAMMPQQGGAGGGGGPKLPPEPANGPGQAFQQMQ